MTDDATAGTGTGDGTVPPLTIGFPPEAVDDMRRRVAATRWPDRETVDDDSQGVPLATMQDLARYWATDYDWSGCESRLNDLPNFVTEIDRLDIHFVHVRSQHENALPLIVTHGWPGSIIEQLKIIEPLTDLTSHGGDAADAFHVVIPSLPGHGFSAKPATTGWDPVHIAGAWVELMHRLGYTEFVAQGGDWGATVTPGHGCAGGAGAARHPFQHAGHRPCRRRPRFRARRPPAVRSLGRGAGRVRTAERLLCQARGVRVDHGDPPADAVRAGGPTVDLAAFMLDHGDGTGQPGLVQQVLEGHLDGDLTRDDLLDNISVCWLTNTGISAARLHWENKGDFFDAKNISIPYAISVFPDELYQAPRSWAERAYPENLIHDNRVDRGGHVAAWEQPQVFCEELRDAFGSLR